MKSEKKFCGNKKGKPFEDFPFCFYESLAGLYSLAGL
jgi:hypothetical protein